MKIEKIKLEYKLSIIFKVENVCVSTVNVQTLALAKEFADAQVISYF